MRDIEHQTQCACVRWFRYQYPNLAMLLYAIPNGGARDRVTGAKLKAEGVVAGVADLFLSVPRCGFHGMYIEMKAGKNTQTESQKEFQRSVESEGYLYKVIRSFDEFMQEVEDYLRNV
ncbi:MAG: VRR-NUC domain-containing protein [Bacteroidales bacterium]|nr:VRR-NUC domain-containing protein [Bacteroidales bacterium]